MSWIEQHAKFGYYELGLRKDVRGGWTYFIDYANDDTGARTKVGEGAEKYKDAAAAQQAAILHLANILPKPQADRLLATQSELVWSPFRDPKKLAHRRRRKKN